MHYWGTEDNVTRSGKTAKGARRPLRPKRSSATRTRAGGSGGRAGRSRRSVASGGSVKNYPFLRQYFQQGGSISGRLQRVLFFIVLSALIYVFVLSDTGLIKITQLRLERSRLDANIAELEQNSKQLETTIARLETDDFYIEKIGRERFSYVHRGERVYKLIPIGDRQF